MKFTRSELVLLYYLKRSGGAVETNRPGLLGVIATATNLTVGIVKASLRALEQQAVILRTYERPSSGTFAGAGYNPLRRVEMIDKQMALPPMPRVPLCAVVAKENEQMYEATAKEPGLEDVCVALVAENEKLRDQISKLQDIVEQQARQLTQATKVSHVPSHLTSRVRDALPTAVWESLTHSNGR